MTLQVDGTKVALDTGASMAVVGTDLYRFGGGNLWTDVKATNAFSRFSTTALQWEQLDGTKVSGVPPSVRYDHDMVAVGDRLYVYGGTTVSGDGRLPVNDLHTFSTTALEWEQLDALLVSGLPLSGGPAVMAAVNSNAIYLGGDDSADLLVLAVAQVFAPPASGFSAAWFTRVYDGDVIQLAGDADWPSGFTADLCLPNMPCSLTITGDPAASSTIRRQADSRIVCDAASGCTGVTMRHVGVACTSETSAAGPLQVLGAGAVATIEDVTFSDCAAVEDGGCIRAYNGAAVKISRTTFQRSSTLVPFLSCHSCKPLTTLPRVLIMCMFANHLRNVVCGDNVHVR